MAFLDNVIRNVTYSNINQETVFHVKTEPTEVGS